jgi:hypothetical protein
VVGCFRPGRRRLNTDLVVAVVQAMHPDVGYVGAVWWYDLAWLHEPVVHHLRGGAPVLAPDFTSDGGHQREFGPLLILRDRIAAEGGGEAALWAER